MTYSLNEVWKIENNFNFDSITNKKKQKKKKPRDSFGGKKNI